MAVDYKAELTAALWTLLQANAGVVAAFKVGNRWDERTTGSRRQRLANALPNDKTNIAIEIVGGDEAATRTPHFGLTGPTATVCDTIIPITVVARITMHFDSEKAGDQTPVERYVRQALHQGYPKLSLSYVRDFTIKEKRTPPSKAPGAVTESQWDLTVTMRFHLSQLRD